MRVLILAAGFGTRLGRLGERLPKALLPVGDRCAIDFAHGAADALPQVRSIDVLTNARFHGELAAWAAGRNPTKPLRVWSDGARRPEERLGAIGDVAWWLERARPREPVLVLASDNVFDFALESLAERAAIEPAVALFDVGSTAAVARLASVELGPRGRVTRFVEKDPAPRGTLACIALYGLPPVAFPEVRTYLDAGGSPDNLGYFIEWLHLRRPVRGLLMTGRWIDVGTPHEHRRAQRLFARGRT
jgi:glucose-1-phosphate thymidylyltransferase